MSYLRQSLTCCVCGNLLYVPMSSTVSSCQHHVCKSCVGGKMRLKPSCSWCKDHSKFIENIQLRILLQCYKQLASFILSSSIVDNWGYLVCETNQASYSSLPNNFNGPTTFRQLLDEGSNFHDKYTFSEPPPLRSFNRQTNGHNNNNTITNNNSNHHNYNAQHPGQQQTNNNNNNINNNGTNNHHGNVSNHLQINLNSSSSSSHHSYSLADGETRNSINVKTVNNVKSYNNLNTNGNRISSITSIGNGINIVGNLLPSITLSEAINGDNTKTGIILKAGSAQAFTLNRNIIKADSTQLNKILTGTLSNNSVTNNNSNNNNTSTTLTNNNSNQTPSVNRKVRRGCRCGLATPNPGKLTCCGQRCPCYVESKACNQCKCRGCRNPNKVSNLTTINIISTSSSTGSMLTSSLTSSTPSTSSITSTSNIITPLITSTTSNSLATSSLTSASKQTESALITIPSSIAANLFQIPIIVNSDGVLKEVGGNNQVLVTTGNIGEESTTLIDEDKSPNDFTLSSQII
ncbi:putative uncharacterized protein DDB_G0282133 isoform X2 [Panonychus citri]|nr:putative uncharacterized protein DDB_G0282133 isoform X2 [Panonychus citri]